MHRSLSRPRVGCRALLLGLLGAFACSSTQRPVEQKVGEAVSVSPVDVAYWATSTGASQSTLVLVHGGPGLDHHVFDGVMETLATETRRVVTYDQRGCGESPAPADGAYDLEAYAADLEALRIRLGAEQLDLMGVSWGGMPVIQYAAMYPHRVGGVVLVDTMPPTQDVMEAGVKQFQRRLSELGERGVISADLPPMPKSGSCREHLMAILPAYFHDPAHPAARDPGVSCNAAVLHATYEDLGDGPLDKRKEMASIAGPALVITGESSPFGLPWAEASRDALTGTDPEFHVVKEAGHMPWVEKPDAFARIVTEFLDSGR